MGLKKNILYNSVLTCSLYLFQFITYPYVARVLGVNNIGICNFATSIVNYFILFSMLGISTVGVREIAQAQDRKELNLVFSRLFTLNVFFTILALIVYCLCIEVIPQFGAYKKLLYIGAFQLVFNLLTIEWLFKGIENFRYITLRTILVRLLYIAAIFIFVREESDYVVYFIISVGMVVVNGLINWNYKNRFVTFIFQSFKACRIYIKQLVLLGSQSFLLSLYTTFNVAFLGFAGNDTEVGYYTTAIKIQGIVLALYSAFTLAVMPRVSSLLGERKDEEVRLLIAKSFDLLFAFAFPLIVLTEVFAPEIIFLVAGAHYEGAIWPMRIVMPLILIIGLEQILIVQLLMPLKADRVVCVNSVIGAGVGLLFNILLVPTLLSIGSAIVWGVAEISVLLSACYFVNKIYLKINLLSYILCYCLYFLPLLLLCLYIQQETAIQYVIRILINIFMIFFFSHMVLYYWIRNSGYRFYFDLYILKYLSLWKK